VIVILSEAKNPLCPLHLLLPNMPLLFALDDCHSERSEESFVSFALAFAKHALIVRAG
jgi:hypothetical protein